MKVDCFFVSMFNHHTGDLSQMRRCRVKSSSVCIRIVADHIVLRTDSNMSTAYVVRFVCQETWKQEHTHTCTRVRAHAHTHMHAHRWMPCRGQQWPGQSPGPQCLYINFLSSPSCTQTNKYSSGVERQ